MRVWRSTKSQFIPYSPIMYHHWSLYLASDSVSIALACIRECCAGSRVSGESRVYSLKPAQAQTDLGWPEAKSQSRCQDGEIIMSFILFPLIRYLGCTIFGIKFLSFLMGHWDSFPQNFKKKWMALISSSSQFLAGGQGRLSWAAAVWSLKDGKPGSLIKVATFRVI